MPRRTRRRNTSRDSQPLHLRMRRLQPGTNLPHKSNGARQPQPQRHNAQDENHESPNKIYSQDRQAKYGRATSHRSLTTPHYTQTHYPLTHNIRPVPQWTTTRTDAHTNTKVIPTHQPPGEIEPSTRVRTSKSHPQEKDYKSQTQQKPNYNLLESKGVLRNGWASPSRVLAGSEHWWCAPKDALSNQGVPSGRAKGPEV